MNVSSTTEADPRATRRVRHEGARRRVLNVTHVDRLTPHLVRVTLSGDLDGFTSLGFDDHLKLFVPGDDGTPAGRDYTPRRFDAAANTLDIEFALHDDDRPQGPATRWAKQAAVGQTLELGGPRGSRVVPSGFDCHVLIADDTGLPAIARRLEELPGGCHALVFIEVDAKADEVQLGSAAQADIHYVHRNGASAGSLELLSKAVMQAKWPKGAIHVWIACESAVAKALRQQLVAERGINPAWLRAAGYWRRGDAAIHDTHD